jgi:UDP-3-O-[3-hydroxymyristoyl] N-acetylglucosamine deacetylase/3-hydroxyacyl-[acyl-carrier-protein] dehydratase
MNEKQRTLKRSVELSGVGLHTGEPVRLILCPAPANHGYKFQRIDLDGQPVIDADADRVVSTERGTTLEQNGAKVHTTEHALAALYALQVDNCLIQLTGPELPILDGSSLPYVEAIESVGYEEQDAERDYFILKEPIWFETKERGTEMLGVPTPGGEFRLTVMVDYNSPVLGTQHASMYRNEEFKTEIAPCRTFVFLRELEQLAKAGLIKGGDLNNAIVLEDREGTTKEQLKDLAKIMGREYQDVEIRRNGVLNTTDLKFFNEPARHKLLDIVGDLALVGRPIKGHILAARPGHFGNTSFAKRIKEKMRAERRTPVGFDLNKSRCTTSTPSRRCCRTGTRSCWSTRSWRSWTRRIIGVKNVTMNEPLLHGPLPGEPGDARCAASGSHGAGGRHLRFEPGARSGELHHLLPEDRRRALPKKVIPGDTIVFHLELLTPIRRGIVHMKGIGYVNGQPAVEAEMMAQIARDKAPAPVAESKATV